MGSPVLPPDFVTDGVTVVNTRRSPRDHPHAAEEWSRPVERGEWWDRAAVPFHVVLAGESATVFAAERR